MMTLSNYLTLMGDEVAAIILKQSERTVRAWRYGVRMPRIDEAYNIEKLTKGKVSVKEIAREAWERKHGNAQ